MPEVALHKGSCHTFGPLPSQGSRAPDFRLVNTKLRDVSLNDFNEPYKILYTVPSVDTMFCANTASELEPMANDFPTCHFMVISADLPFAFQRFAKDHHIKKLLLLSLMRSKKFGKDYGVLMIDGAMAGLLARSLWVLDSENNILYQELTPELGKKPDFEAAFKIISKG